VQITTDTNFREKYCGSEVPTILSFDAKVMNLKFVSDESQQRRGFKIMYKIYRRTGIYSVLSTVPSVCKVFFDFSYQPLGIREILQISYLFMHK